MLTPKEAQEVIFKHQVTGKQMQLSLAQCRGYVLAENVSATLDLPVFNNSAMDGFALLYEDTMTATENNPVQLKIIEEIWAGKLPQQEIAKGCCARIMTGAPMPKGATAVVMQEYVTGDKDSITLTGPVKPKANIRFQGEEIETGDLLLAKGSLLNPAAISLLASMGMTTCPVYESPQVTIIPTGTELVPIDQKLGEAQIYESSSYALQAAMQEIGIQARVSKPVQDDQKALRETIESALSNSTHIIICGGVSVGQYDYNKFILRDLKVKDIFWKVAQKPGKPMFYGIKNETSVFGMPGNPASSLVCYYNYVRPALLKYKGYTHTEAQMPKLAAKLSQALNKKPGRAHFIRGNVSGQGDHFIAEPLHKQGSNMMVSFAQANCLIELPAEAEHLDEGTQVTVHRL
jgi:molybdopterin molybdotransferase